MRILSSRGKGERIVDVGSGVTSDNDGVDEVIEVVDEGVGEDDEYGLLEDAGEEEILAVGDTVTGRFSKTSVLTSRAR